MDSYSPIKPYQISIKMLVNFTHSVHLFVVVVVFFGGGGGGVEPPIKSSKMERLGRTSTFRGGCWEKGGEFFQERRLRFLHEK